MSAPSRAPRTFAALLPAAVAALALLPADVARAGDGGPAGVVEREFAAAIHAVTPATVDCVSRAGAGEESVSSSGVVVSRQGHVLSDGDAGAVIVRGPGRGAGQRIDRRDVVEIRVPDLRRGTFAVYTARLVKRVLEVDSSLWRIEKPPSSLAYLPPATSDDLRVGAFTFAMGTAFGMGSQGTAALTGGIVAALVRAPEGDPAGRYTEVYTSAAVNPGVNGGPLVDVEGRLVAVVSTWGQPEPDNPFQFLGKAIPIDRVRAAYRDTPEAFAVLARPKDRPARSKQAGMLERALGTAARRGREGVVSLTVERSTPLRMSISRGDGPPLEMPRFAGSVSGVVASADGWIVTSLYNLANVLPISFPGAQNHDDVWRDVRAVTGATVHFHDGTTAPARVVAHDEVAGIVLLKADLPTGYVPRALPAAPDASREPGRFLVCVGDPFGDTRNPDALATFGVVSRVHPADAEDPWRGDLQTDAGLTDTTCGGVLVDLDGALVAVATLWNPVQHGRNSGIGFGVPWSSVEAALPALKEGKSRRLNGWLGVSIRPSTDGATAELTEVVAGSPAATAGLLAGDRIESVGSKTSVGAEGLLRAIRLRAPGERLSLGVSRGGKRVEATVVLGERPPAETTPPR